MTLSLLSILLGAGLAVPQVYALTHPARFNAAARRLPRHLPAGIALMLAGTAWFLWIVHQEPIADFSAYKPVMLAAFAAVGVLTCVFVQDFLAVRGLAVLLLLLGKVMVDTGRPHLGASPWVLVIQVWAYILILAGIGFTITPWKFRDCLDWATATEARTRRLSALRLGFAAALVILGLTVFRGM